MEYFDNNNPDVISEEYPVDAALFGPMGAATAKLCREISKDFIGKQLPLMTVEQFSSVKDVARINQIYWRDVLYRVYWAAGLNIMRHQRWQSGVVMLKLMANSIVFPNCWRTLHCQNRR